MRRRLDFSQILWYNFSRQTFLRIRKGSGKSIWKVKRMGIMLGISDIMIGVGILWQMRRYAPLKKGIRHREWRDSLSFTALFFSAGDSALYSDAWGRRGVGHYDVSGGTGAFDAVRRYFQYTDPACVQNGNRWNIRTVPICAGITRLF